MTHPRKAMYLLLPGDADLAIGLVHHDHLVGDPTCRLENLSRSRLCQRRGCYPNRKEVNQGTQHGRPWRAAPLRLVSAVGLFQEREPCGQTTSERTPMSSSIVPALSLSSSVVMIAVTLLNWRLGRRRLVLRRRLGEAYDKVVLERGRLFGEADMARTLRRYDRALGRLIDPDERRPQRGRTTRSGPPLR